MVTVSNDLTVIKVYWENKGYQVKFEDVEYTDKQSIDTTFSSDSKEPNRVIFGKMEYSLDLSGGQSHRWLFEWIRERQKSGIFKNYPGVTTYKYVKGKSYPDKIFTKVFVEEIKQKNQEGYDVKLIPLATQYRDGDSRLLGRDVYPGKKKDETKKK